LAIAEKEGARTQLLDVVDLGLPPLEPGLGSRPHPGLEALAAALADSDGVIVASPVYASTVSAAVKNVLDHIHDTAAPKRLRGIAAGVIAVADGPQTATTLSDLHTACTALGAQVARTRVGLNRAEMFDQRGVLCDPIAINRLDAMVLEVIDLIVAADGVRSLDDTGHSRYGVGEPA
jgi:NAD(P)H-dependent FMN reductase